MSCSHCAELEARIRQMEADRRIERGRRVVAELASRLGLEDQPARVLAALFHANGRILSRDFLMDEVLPAGRVETRTSKSLDIVVWKVRKVAGFDAVQTHPGRGYSITTLGCLICEEALERRAVAA
jgi:DNA-binding response OmpR family regulator